MLNVRNGFTVRAILTLALAAAPLVVTAADSGRKAPTLDLNAKMQQKLSSSLNGQIKTDAPASSIDSKLSARVDEKSAAVNEQLDEQATSLTAADRSGEKNEAEQKANAPRQ